MGYNTNSYTTISQWHSVSAQWSSHASFELSVNDDSQGQRLRLVADDNGLGHAGIDGVPMTRVTYETWACHAGATLSVDH